MQIKASLFVDMKCLLADNAYKMAGLYGGTAFESACLVAF